MLHILLLILKIIGIILAVILGILILLVCIILFVPIRYDVSAKCKGTIDTLQAKVKTTWLLRLVSVDVFLKGKKVKWQVRIAWAKKSNQKNASTVGETNRKGEKNNESKDDEPQKVEETAVNVEAGEEKHEDCPEEIKEQRLEEDFETASETTETTSRKANKIKGLIEKIKEFLEKKEKITNFLTDKSHVNAFKKVKKELLILLKRLKPKKANVKLRFGFDDPSTTGKVLGGLSMLYPFFGDTIEIFPDFEKQVLKGHVYLKGKIRCCHFAWLALKLLLCKDIRTSYKDIRNFKL